MSERKNNVALWLAILAAALLAACQPVRNTPTVMVTPYKVADEAQVRWEGADLIVDILSPSGISGVHLVWPDNLPSDSVILRLHLRGLESLRVKNLTGMAALSVASSPPYEVRSEGKAADITIQRQLGRFDVHLGPTWLQAGSLAVEWVDFYR